MSHQTEVSPEGSGVTREFEGERRLVSRGSGRTGKSVYGPGRREVDWRRYTAKDYSLVLGPGQQV